MEEIQVKEAQQPTGQSLESPRPAPPRFTVGDTVWIVTSGNQEKWAECPDCFGQCALTVILGDGSQVSVECNCCSYGWEGSRGSVRVYEWRCDVVQDTITGMEIEGNDVRYRFAHRFFQPVFATKEEAEDEAATVLSGHQADEARRFYHVKEQAHKSWAWHVHYHRRCAKDAKQTMEHHEAKLVVAKAKAKLPEEAEPK